MAEEFFIASYVARIDPEKTESLKDQISEVKFAEFVASDLCGKAVIVFDAPSHKKILDSADEIRDLPGVMSFLPVYQHAE
jgi:nitrate reductase NapAB chaperone NapD